MLLLLLGPSGSASVQRNPNVRPCMFDSMLMQVQARDTQTDTHTPTHTQGKPRKSAGPGTGTQSRDKYLNYGESVKPAKQGGIREMAFSQVTCVCVGVGLRVITQHLRNPYTNTHPHTRPHTHTHTHTHTHRHTHRV